MFNLGYTPELAEVYPHVARLSGGLRLEAESVHELIRKVEDVSPELVELNRE